MGVVEALLGARADCDVQNSNGNTPLHLAAGKGWLDVAERLAAAGADPHIKNSKGWLAIQASKQASQRMGGAQIQMPACLPAPVSSWLSRSNGPSTDSIAGCTTLADPVSLHCSSAPFLPACLQSASNSGYFEVVLKLVQHGSPWRLKGEADVVKLLSKKSSYK